MKKFLNIVLLILCCLGLVIALTGLIAGTYYNLIGLKSSPSVLGTLIGMVLSIAFWIWIISLLIRGLNVVWNRLKY